MAGTQARSVYEFVTDEPGELSFGKGEVLTIIRQDVGDGWWEGKNSSGRQGIVPEAYLEIISVPEPQFPPPPPPPSAQPRSSWQQPQAQPPKQQNSWQPPSNQTWQQPQQSQSAPVAAAPVSAKPMRQQDSYEDWDDDDWDDDDDDSTTTEATGELSGGGNYGLSSANREKGSNANDTQKIGTVRKPFSRFSTFTKQGGEAYLFNMQQVIVPDMEKTNVVDSMDGPVWEQTEDPFFCTISQPRKESKFHGMKSFIAYQITPSFSNIQVSRRYKHFDWLHDRLEIKFSTICIPPLPDKQIAGRFEEDFIQERMRQLQLWIDRLCKHPVIRRSDVFSHFLTCTEEKRWKQGKRRAEKDDFQGVRFFHAIQPPAAPLDAKVVDGKMESYTKYVKSMDDSIRHLFNVGESNIKKHTGVYKKENQKLGQSFIALAKSFEHDERPCSRGLTEAVDQTGRIYEEIGKMYEEQPRNDMLHLMDGVLEYKGILSTLPDVLSVYRAATAKIQENAGKLSESEIQGVQRKADIISYTTLAEMNIFQQTRVSDFSNYMQSYLKGQIEFHQRITAKLQEALGHYDA